MSTAERQPSSVASSCAGGEDAAGSKKGAGLGIQAEGGNQGSQQQCRGADAAGAAEGASHREGALLD